MKNTSFVFAFLVSCLLLFSSCTNASGNWGGGTTEVKDGDIIFQVTGGAQSEAIKITTRSKYSHCGIIYAEGSDIYVYEALQPVRKTLLEDWIEHGEGGHYVIKRLKNDKVLKPATLAKMKDIARQQFGKDYDIYFGWSDDKLYCSEYVWKIYKEGAGIEVGKLRQLKDFDLSHPSVQKIVKERYGDKVPLEETVISPAAIFESDLLMTVKED